MNGQVVQHLLVSDEEAAEIAATMIDPKVINLEGVELRIETVPEKHVRIVAFTVTGRCATINIPFAGESASL